jgi:WD40 repeat protein
MVTLWDVTTGEERCTLKGHTGDVHAVAFHPDCKTLASAGGDKTVRLWDLATGQERAILERRSEYDNPIAFSPDGSLLACGSSELIQVWEIATHEERRALEGHKSFVKIIAFSPDGKTLASADVPCGSVKIWDIATAKERAFEAPPWMDDADCYILGIAFSPDGKTIALTTFYAIGLWDVTTGKNKAALGWGHRPLDLSIRCVLDSLGGPFKTKREMLSVAYTPDGSLVAYGMDNTTLERWKVAAVPRNKN